MKLRFSLLLLIIVVIAAACDGGGDDETTEPSEVPDVATATITPEPQAEQEAVPTNTPLQEPPTLPPSWTPESPATSTQTIPTATAVPTEREDQSSGQSEAATPRPECASFVPDFAATTSVFDLGTSPTLAWTDVPNATLYRVFILDEGEFELHMELVESNSYSVPADKFPQAGFYIWRVEPLDNLGIQMCIGLGDVLTAE